MVISSHQLAEFERRFEGETYSDLAYAGALARYAALWAYARELSPDVGTDWQDDLEPDLAIARAVNGLSPTP